MYEELTPNAPKVPYQPGEYANVRQRTEAESRKEDKEGGDSGVLKHQPHCGLRSQLYDWRSKMIRRISASLLAALLVVGAFGTLAACNTMEGVGQDIQQGGRAIKDEAREKR